MVGSAEKETGRASLKSSSQKLPSKPSPKAFHDFQQETWPGCGGGEGGRATWVTVWLWDVSRTGRCCVVYLSKQVAQSNAKMSCGNVA